MGHIIPRSISVRVGIIGGINFLILVLGYFLLIKENAASLKLLQIQENRLKIDFESKQLQASHLSASRNQLESMNQSFKILLKELENKNELPHLLEEISKTGVDVGLNFELFAPQPELIHDFYNELPIKIIAGGSYMQLALFISRIAEWNKIITFHEFSIEKLVSKNSISDELRINITVKIYRDRKK